jgi:hypothetical protein
MKLLVEEVFVTEGLPARVYFRKTPKL